MPFDREGTLRKAEKLLRQGKLDLAIAEYRAVIDDQPADWNTANTLGDLYVRAGQVDRAIAEYNDIAAHLANEGFFPGMQEEAMKGFEAAARSPRHRFRAGAMLAKAYLDSGDRAHAGEYRDISKRLEQLKVQMGS